MKVETLKRQIKVKRAELLALRGTSNGRRTREERARENRKDTLRKTIRRMEGKLSRLLVLTSTPKGTMH